MSQPIPHGAVDLGGLRPNPQAQVLRQQLDQAQMQIRQLAMFTGLLFDRFEVDTMVFTASEMEGAKGQLTLTFDESTGDFTLARVHDELPEPTTEPSGPIPHEG